MRDSTERFSTRVDNYVKFRPDYPLGVTDILKNACGLTSSAVIADVGSGTGIFSKKLLAQGFTVIGVEPNREMREAGDPTHAVTGAVRYSAREFSCSLRVRVLDGFRQSLTDWPRL